MSDIKKYSSILCDTPWLSLIKMVKPEDGIMGYIYSHETRCNGKIVAVLPFREESDGQRSYLIRNEFTPCWGFENVDSSITGGVEHEDQRDTAVEEMAQEAGYEITKEDLIPLGTSFASKSADTIYYLFAVNLTGREKTLKGDGDGSLLEKKATMHWVAESEIPKIRDPQVSVMYVRLKVGV